MTHPPARRTATMIRACAALLTGAFLTTLLVTAEPAGVAHAATPLPTTVTTLTVVDTSADEGDGSDVSGTVSGTIVYPTTGYTYDDANPPTVTAYAADDNPVSDATPDIDGNFVIDGLTDGETYLIGLSDDSGALLPGYYLSDTASLTTGIDAATGITAPVENLTLRPQLAASLTATVTFPASGYTFNPAQPPEVAAIDAGGNEVATDTVTTHDKGATYSAHLGGLTPEAVYTLSFRDETQVLAVGYYVSNSKNLASDEALAASITAGITTAVTLKPVLAVTITGSIVFAGGGYTRDADNPLSVQVQDSDGAEISSAEVTVASGGATGTFSVGGIASGSKYYLYLDDETGAILSGYYVSDTKYLTPLIDDATPVTAPRGAVVLNPQAVASIAVSVTLPSGYTYDSDNPPSVEARDADENQITSTPIDRDGTATLTGLAAGTTYLLYLNDATGTLVSGYYISNAASLGATVAGATPVTAPSTSAILAPRLAVSESGTVVWPASYTYDSDNAPTVDAYDAADNLIGSTAVASDGTFTIAGLTAGVSYTLLYTHPDDAVPGGYYVDNAAGVADDVTDATLVAAPASGLRLDPLAEGTLPLTPTPRTTGTYAVDKTVTVVPGSWGTKVSLEYQWRRNGVDIDGATARTYRLTVTDYAKKITVAVTGSRGGYASATTVSAPQTVRAGTLSTTAVPTITGTAKLGKKLKATTGSWTTGVAFTYKWLRNGKAITKATKPTYTLTAKDKGKKISVAVTGKKKGYLSVTKTSRATSSVR